MLECQLIPAVVIGKKAVSVLWGAFKVSAKSSAMVELDRFIESISPSLIKHSDGDWRAPSNARVSYPQGASSFFAPIEEGSYWFSHRNSCIVSLMRQFPPKGPILDVGGGNGFVSLGLKRSGIRAIVLEPGPGADVAH